MNKLTLKNSRHIDLCMDDVVYRNDNLITTIFMIFPDKIDEYPRKDCNVELRAILPNGDYLPYNIPTAEGKASFLITNDLTEAAQVVKLMMIITHNGNVIGSTNEQEINVKEPTKTLKPLTPRAEFDEIIADLRAQVADLTEDKAELTAEVLAKDQTISEKNSEISGLNTQVGELEGEVSNLEAENALQADTIRELNNRVPPLETPDPVTPTTQQQTIRPTGDNVGLAAVTVNGVTAEIDSNIQPENIRNGVSVLGVRGNGDFELQKFLARDTFQNLQLNVLQIYPYLCYKYASLNSIEFLQPPLSIDERAFSGCVNLKTVVVPHGTEVIGLYVFDSCASLQEIHLPNSINQIQTYSLGGPPLRRVYLEQDFNSTLYLGFSNMIFSVEIMLGMLNALKDLTGETAKTLYLGSNSQRLAAEEIAIATNKNWNLV